MPVFPSYEWVEAWVALANASREFEASGRGWEGAVGLVIEADAAAGVPDVLYVRLDGRDGKWLDSRFGTHGALVEGAVIVLRAPYRRWKDVIAQDLSPLKGLLQGKLTVKGHLPVVLRWTKSMAVLAELAGHIDTQFIDEGVAAAGRRRHGARD